MSTNKARDPFQFEQSATTDKAGVRKLDFTPMLINTADTRASELMVTVSKKPELHALANQAIDTGETTALFDLIHAVYTDEQIAEDAQILAGASEDQLSRLLESRRSDRSKTKAKGLRSNVQVCRNWISCGYAEILVRKAWDKPYDGPAHELDASDLEAVNAKIRSLQSKKSRLNKLAGFDAEAKKEFEAVEAEIERLQALRPGTRVQTKTVLKDASVDDIRNILKAIDPADLPESERVAYEELMAKLG